MKLAADQPTARRVFLPRRTLDETRDAAPPHGYLRPSLLDQQPVGVLFQPGQTPFDQHAIPAF